uniref:Uncharacterized protein n=1 Tax=Amphimedon queenslandica TaxID=400682 RepID=A0A1X7UTT2_AMPQE
MAEKPKVMSKKKPQARRAVRFRDRSHGTPERRYQHIGRAVPKRHRRANDTDSSFSCDDDEWIDLTDEEEEPTPRPSSNPLPKAKGTPESTRRNRALSNAVKDLRDILPKKCDTSNYAKTVNCACKELEAKKKELEALRRQLAVLLKQVKDSMEDILSEYSNDS